MDLKDVLKRKKEIAERTERPKVNWFKVGENQKTKVVFLQELEADAPLYDSSKGNALFLVEHVSPHDFRRRADCTAETEGRCFACEMKEEEPNIEGGDWRQRTNMYIQLWDDGDETVKVLSRPAFGGFIDALISYATDDNEGNITDTTFSISKGAKKSDSWTLMPLKNNIEVPDSALAELVDLDKAVRNVVAYDKQRNFYIPAGSEEKAEKPAAKPKVEATEDSIDW